MAKYRIGVTEAGDAGIDLSWVRKDGHSGWCGRHHKADYTRFP